MGRRTVTSRKRARGRGLSRHSTGPLLSPGSALCANEKSRVNKKKHNKAGNVARGKHPRIGRRQDSVPTKRGQAPNAGMTRDWGLLVSDQAILDLVGRCNAHTLYTLAERFVLVLNAIKNNDIGAIRIIEKESRAASFRKVVTGINRGLSQGHVWSARHTARAVIAEAFHHTPAYFQALDTFTTALMVKRLRR